MYISAVMTSQWSTVQVWYGLVNNGRYMVGTVAVAPGEPKGAEQAGPTALAGPAGRYAAHGVSAVHVVVSGGDVPLVNCHPAKSNMYTIYSDAASEHEGLLYYTVWRIVGNIYVPYLLQ